MGVVMNLAASQMMAVKKTSLLMKLTDSLCDSNNDNDNNDFKIDAYAFVFLDSFLFLFDRYILYMKNTSSNRSQKK